ncbi:MAG TPA: SRPBCC family protein [Gemmatimonadales bacterium]|nr:SRPBCC family protein [Gemmatimonadales bacterium]
MTRTAALKITTPSEREVAVTREFDAPRGMVFDAHTKPELVRQWLLGPPGWTMPVCEIDLRVGGKYRYEWANADGRRMGVAGKFTEITRPSRIVVTQLFDEDWTGGETLVTTDLVERSGKTTLTTTVRYSSRDARDAALKTGMTTGMEAGYERLEELLKAEHSHG